MSEAPHHQLEETPPGDARDPARSEVDADAADVPPVDGVNGEDHDPADAPTARAGSEEDHDPTDDPTAQAGDEADHPPADVATAQASSEEGHDPTDAPPADGQDEVRREGTVGGHVIRTVDFSQPTKFTAELRRRIMRALGSF